MEAHLNIFVFVPCLAAFLCPNDRKFMRLQLPLSPGAADRRNPFTRVLFLSMVKGPHMSCRKFEGRSVFPL